MRVRFRYPGGPFGPAVEAMLVHEAHDETTPAPWRVDGDPALAAVVEARLRHAYGVRGNPIRSSASRRDLRVALKSAALNDLDPVVVG